MKDKSKSKGYYLKKINGRRRQRFPVHIAIIMDGNGRWAKSKGLSRIEGHNAGAKSVRKIVEMAVELKLKYLMLFTFSTENWKRPVTEVRALMKLLKNELKDQREDLKNNNVRFSYIGNLKKFNKALVNELKSTIDFTAGCTGLNLILALNYGARDEIVNAVNRIISEGKIRKVNSRTFKKYLYTKDIPDPDLLIRTSGEYRISNFLLWQIAYTEIYITDVLWPDFHKVEFLKAIHDYQRRERRFGGV